MSLRRRRIIFSIFTLAFFIIAPIVFISSLGYDYDWRKNKLVKTGLLMLHPRPLDVTIKLNGSPLVLNPKDGTYRIPDLLPNTYHVQIEKTGYVPWKKDLEVQSQRTTFAYDIALFKNSLPLLLRSGEFRFADQNNDNVLLIEHTAVGDIVVYLNLKNGAIRSLFPVVKQLEKFLTVSIQDAQWSASHGKILITLTDQQHLILDVRNPSLLVPLESEGSFAFTHPQWSEIGDHIFNGWSGLRLLEINLNSLDKKTLAEIKLNSDETLLSEYYVSSKNLFYFTQNTTRTTLHKLSLSNQSTPPTTLMEFSRSSQLQFLRTRSETPDFVDIGAEKTFLFLKPDDMEPIELPATVIHEREKRWLYNNTFELALWNQETRQTKLITRFSQPIQESFWHPEFEYAFFRFENSISIVELDTRDHLNQWELSRFDHISKLVTNTEGNIIYFLGQIGKQQGIYQLPIQ